MFGINNELLEDERKIKQKVIRWRKYNKLIEETSKQLLSSQIKNIKVNNTLEN